MAKHLTAALALAGAASVQAAPITTTQTISLGELLTSGQSANISFNLNSQLAQLGRGAQDILEADLIVYGYSDAQYNQNNAMPYSGYENMGTSSHTVYVPYTYTYYVGNGCYYTWLGSRRCESYSPVTGTAYYSFNVTDTSSVRSRDIAHRDTVADTMLVDVAGQQGSDSASTTSNSAGSYGAPVYERTDGSYQNGYLYRYVRERDTYEAISGALEVAFHLNADALKSLTSDGILEALVSAPLGQFRLQTASLTYVTGDPSSEVPEPGTLGLMAAAALGAAAVRRRNKA
ncbi:PEP-CTERM sorting domain-containing protein [Massilia sp. ZL223]|uniref:PEP-CTERM sorting domain-containing protein n=1 Tax=Massilia sp. ZL223 TaxID=2824904 RepID=UPI001B8353A4|nr:PEP-CTERM sorting domain-containing protein [Massilia sp. ZL223]MBQ5965730.1 PEP-CTERM sorting domain-containing protein [Massilia sp. ZL223]